MSDSEEADGGKEDDAESNAGDASQADEWDCRTGEMSSDMSMYAGTLSTRG